MFVVPTAMVQVVPFVLVHPVQPMNVPVAFGEAVSCTDVPEVTVVEQLLPQLIVTPVVDDTTLPAPTGPLSVTSRLTCKGLQVGAAPLQVPSAWQVRVWDPLRENPTPHE